MRSIDARTSRGVTGAPLEKRTFGRSRKRYVRPSGPASGTVVARPATSARPPRLPRAGSRPGCHRPVHAPGRRRSGRRGRPPPPALTRSVPPRCVAGASARRRPDLAVHERQPGRACCRPARGRVSERAGIDMHHGLIAGVRDPDAALVRHERRRGAADAQEARLPRQSRDRCARPCRRCGSRPRPRPARRRSAGAVADREVSSGAPVRGSSRPRGRCPRWRPRSRRRPPRSPTGRRRRERLLAPPRSRSMRVTVASTADATQSAPAPTATARAALPTSKRCTTRLVSGATCATVRPWPSATHSDPAP